MATRLRQGLGQRGSENFALPEPCGAGPAINPRPVLRTIHKLALALGAACTFSAHAQVSELSGTIDARITLLDGCAIFGAINGPATGADFGMIEFGAQASTFTGVVDGRVTGGAGGTGVTQIICSPDVSGLTISVDGGQHAGQGGTIGVGSRAMAFGSSFLPYEVYSDPAMTTPYPVGAPQSIATPSSGPVDLPIYGRVNKTDPGALATGTYTDQLLVTLTW